MTDHEVAHTFHQLPSQAKQSQDREIYLTVSPWPPPGLNFLYFCWWLHSACQHNAGKVMGSIGSWSGMRNRFLLLYAQELLSATLDLLVFCQFSRQEHSVPNMPNLTKHIDAVQSVHRCLCSSMSSSWVIVLSQVVHAVVWLINRLLSLQGIYNTLHVVSSPTLSPPKACLQPVLAASSYFICLTQNTMCFSECVKFWCPIPVSLTHIHLVVCIGFRAAWNRFWLTLDSSLSPPTEITLADNYWLNQLMPIRKTGCYSEGFGWAREMFWKKSSQI